MTPLEYLKEITVVLPRLARQTGHSTFGFYTSFVYDFFRYHITLDEFSASHVYELSPRKMSELLTTSRRNRLTARYFNAAATKDDFDLLDNKPRFNTLFKKFIYRDWLDASTCSPDDIRAFIAKNPVFLAKDSLGTQGDNIFLHHSAQTDVDAFLQDHLGKPILLEGFIQQHPAMAAVNPTSVNTIRIVTACMDGQVMLVGAGMRCGGSNAYVDNFHKGGIAYPVDIQSGIVTGMGQNLMGQADFLRHPATGHVMPGFQVPHWDKVKQAVSEAALLLPRLGYVGWDVAITENGPEFIEGNNCPQTDLIQLGGHGVYRELRDFAVGHARKEAHS